MESGGVQITFRCCTVGRGLVGNTEKILLISVQLDWMILQIFSNVGDSMIPFHDSTLLFICTYGTLAVTRKRRIVI